MGRMLVCLLGWSYDLAGFKSRLPDLSIYSISTKMRVIKCWLPHCGHKSVPLGLVGSLCAMSVGFLSSLFGEVV